MAKRSVRSNLARGTMFGIWGTTARGEEFAMTDSLKQLRQILRQFPASEARYMPGWMYDEGPDGKGRRVGAPDWDRKTFHASSSPYFELDPRPRRNPGTLNSIETYQQAGTKAGKAHRQGDDSRAMFEGQWLERALNLENRKDRAACREAFNEAYRQASGFYEMRARSNPRQVLLTAAVRKSIPPLYSYEKTPPHLVPIAVKFFSPYSNWTWYATEGEQQGDDFVFFGLVRGHETELGYFSLRELESATGMGGRLPLVERDAHFGRHSLAEAQAKQI